MSCFNLERTSQTDMDSALSFVDKSPIQIFEHLRAGKLSHADRFVPSLNRHKHIYAHKWRYPGHATITKQSLPEVPCEGEMRTYNDIINAKYETIDTHTKTNRNKETHFLGCVVNPVSTLVYTEPAHDKTYNKTYVTIKLQITLCIHPVWQGFSFIPLWIIWRL